MSDQTATALPGERGASPVGGPRPGMRRRHVVATVAVVVAGFVAYSALHRPTKAPPDKKPALIAQSVQWEPAKEPATPPPMPAIAAPPIVPAAPLVPAMPRMTAASDPLATARKAPLFGPSQQQTQTVAPKASDRPSDPVQVQPASPGSLAARLQPTLLAGSSATVLPHPNMTITEGTLIPCVLDTAIDSTAPGFVTCTTTQDVYGTTGSVVLLERGTKIVGEYRDDMRHGQDRIFVVWDRAETPDHVIIALGSPGADALGRAGFAGQVDTHFWARFGGALMLSLIDSGLGAAASIFSSHGGTFLNLGPGQSAADTALRNSINIPPTLQKNQGEMVSVMAAKDLDFSSVYGLALKNGR